MTTQIRPRISSTQLEALGTAADLIIEHAPANDPRIYIWEAVDSRLRAEQAEEGQQIRPRMGLGEIEATADICTLALAHDPENEAAKHWAKLQARMRKEIVKAAAAIVANAGGTITNLNTSEACMN